MKQRCIPLLLLALAALGGGGQAKLCITPSCLFNHARTRIPMDMLLNRGCRSNKRKKECPSPHPHTYTHTLARGCICLVFSSLLCGFPLSSSPSLSLLPTHAFSSQERKEPCLRDTLLLPSFTHLYGLLLPSASSSSSSPFHFLMHTHTIQTDVKTHSYFLPGGGGLEWVGG